MVTEEDIVTVATSMFMEIDGDTIQWVLENYDNYAVEEEFMNQSDIIERMLYQISEWRG